MFTSLLVLIPLALSHFVVAAPFAGNETLTFLSKRDTQICGFSGRLVSFESCLPAGINFKLNADGKTVTKTTLTKNAQNEFEVPAPAKSSECGQSKSLFPFALADSYFRSYHRIGFAQYDAHQEWLLRRGYCTHQLFGRSIRAS